MKSDFPWLGFMQSHLGEHELAGKDQNNPFILALFAHTTYQPSTDETPWCAAAVSAALEETGFKSTHNAAASSYEVYGKPCELKVGCVVVLQFPNGGKHVTFCNSVMDEERFVGLGGNQANQIKNSIFQREEIIATRWPVKT